MHLQGTNDKYDMKRKSLLPDSFDETLTMEIGYANKELIDNNLEADGFSDFIIGDNLHW